MKRAAGDLLLPLSPGLADRYGAREESIALQQMGHGMDTLGLEAASALIDGALAKAKALALKPLAVIVLDAGGIPIAFVRQDGASNLRFELARGKAFGALGLGVSSRMIGQMAAERPAFVQAAIAASDGRMVPTAGGVIIVGSQGQIVGAVGISGDNSDNDELCALAGITHAGLVAAA